MPLFARKANQQLTVEGEVKAKAAKKAKAPAAIKPTEHDGLTYVVTGNKKVVVRKGFAPSSKKVLELKKGAEFQVLQSKTAASGVTRLKSSRGWVDLTKQLAVKPAADGSGPTPRTRLSNRRASVEDVLGDLVAAAAGGSLLDAGARTTEPPAVIELPPAAASDAATEPPAVIELPLAAASDAAAAAATDSSTANEVAPPAGAVPAAAAAAALQTQTPAKSEMSRVLVQTPASDASQAAAAPAEQQHLPSPVAISPATWGRALVAEAELSHANPDSKTPVGRSTAVGLSSREEFPAYKPESTSCFDFLLPWRWGGGGSGGTCSSSARAKNEPLLDTETAFW
eukprot:SAG22_NODE_13_length_33548_cov_57.167773_31_plen_341_part_00